MSIQCLSHHLWDSINLASRFNKSMTTNNLINLYLFVYFSKLNFLEIAHYYVIYLSKFRAFIMSGNYSVANPSLQAISFRLR